MDTQGRRACDEKDRDYSNTVTSQGMARNAGPHQKLEGKHGTDPLSEEINPANTLILDFWPKSTLPTR